jgi:predicted amidohydrolase
MAAAWDDQEKSLAKAEAYVCHAAASGADIICFPEQFATGWTIVTSLQQYAKESGIAILGSFRERASPCPRNTAVAIGKNGEILTTYAKIHLFSPAQENRAYGPGSALGVFCLGPVTCGIAICYDLRFPELFRAYARAGVHVVFVPSAWPGARIGHFKLFIRARAAENQMYVVGINTTGTSPVDTYSGESITADPGGNIISRASGAEQLVFTDIDMNIVEGVRTSFPVHEDRRDALYFTLNEP